MSKFVHLHTHSHYSLLDGLGKIPDLVSRAKELGMDSLAITDHGTMYGAIEFYKECKSSGIKPIIGVETYVAPRRMTDKQPKVDTSPYHLILLAKNEAGYKNLMQLVTKAHLEGFYYKPRIDKELLKEYSEGIIATTACLFGEIPQMILNHSWTQVKETTEKYLDIFGKDNFYLELQDHPEIKDQQKVNDGLKKLAKEYGLPLICTCDIHYVKIDDREAHEVLLAVQTGKDFSDEGRMSLKEVNLSMRSPEELEKIFDPEVLANTVKLAEKCNLEISLGQIILPKFNVPKNETSKSYLEKLCFEGAKRRYGQISKEVKERLDYELSVIEKCHFEDYFLIVSDYVNFARNSGILVGPGRGSAAGAIVAYVLGITDIDPLYYNIIFERFLNPERISPPDIDLDFADDRREEVIQYISKKFGSDHVAQIITFGVMKARMAIRDVARALGMSYDDGDRIAKLIPMGLSLDEALGAISELKSIYETEAKFTHLIDMAKQLENVARNAGTHAAGVVISQQPLVNYTPLQHPPKGDESLVTQYSMNYLDAIGLLKVDILGLANLTIIKNAIRIIRKIADVEIELDKIPPDDPKTYELLSRAQTSGVFQLESDGMKRYLKELKPSTFEDILSMVALYRPGPMESIPDFIAGKHGRKKITYLDPKLEPILKNTYGVIVTQDQVLEIARYFAGFTYAQADILRKAVGKKIKKLLDEQKEKFILGAQKEGADKKTAQAVWDFIEPFAKYGFNRAHAACYAMISYQTAYLKAHYPSAFMAAWLTAEQQNIDKVAIATAECKRMKIDVLPPDVNESFVEFGVVKETGKIRFGLAAVKNVGVGVSDALVEERKKNGPYKSLEDFLIRLSNKTLNKKVIEALAKAGGLDGLVERNQILVNMDYILKFIGGGSAKVSEGQMGLFSAQAKIAPAKLKLEDTIAASKKERLAWEKELLGMYVSEHPLQGMERILKNHANPISSIPPESSNQKVKVCGIITRISKILTKSNEPMLFVTVEDTTAKCEVLVFPKVLSKDNNIWQADSIVLVEGRTNTKDGALKVIAEQAKQINLDSENQIPCLYIKIDKSHNKDILQQIKTIIEKYPGPAPVILCVPHNGTGKEIKTKTKVEICESLKNELGELIGKENIEN